MDILYNSGFIKTPIHDNIKILYADMTASGQPSPIVENFLIENVYPYYANTHSNAYCGKYMADLITEARQYIRKAYSLKDEHKIIFTGNGTTGAINHLISILDIDVYEKVNIVMTMFEHHSNYLPWKELEKHKKHVKVHMIESDSLDEKDVFNMTKFKQVMEMINKDEKCSMNIISVIGISNVTGIKMPIDDIMNVVKFYNKEHKKNYFFGDYASAAPHMKLDLSEHDGAFFSGHKFIGGPGSPGVLIAVGDVFRNGTPYAPGGGCVRKANNNVIMYEKDLEKKESGGTPNILGILRLYISVKETIDNIDKIQFLDRKILEYVHEKLLLIKKYNNNFDVLYLNTNMKDRLPIISFFIKNVHYNIIVIALNDFFGIQSRGGISCCGQLGEFINNKYGVMGWCRVTFHWTMTTKEITYIIRAIAFMAKNINEIKELYTYDDKEHIYVYNGKQISDNLLKKSTKIMNHLDQSNDDRFNNGGLNVNKFNVMMHV